MRQEAFSLSVPEGKARTEDSPGGTRNESVVPLGSGTLLSHPKQVPATSSSN